MTDQSLFHSPKYKELKDWMQYLYKSMTDEAFDEYVKDKPHLFDPNYVGHDKNGNPDPIFKERR